MQRDTKRQSKQTRESTLRYKLIPFSSEPIGAFLKKHSLGSEQEKNGPQNCGWLPGFSIVTAWNQLEAMPLSDSVWVFQRVANQSLFPPRFPPAFHCVWASWCMPLIHTRTLSVDFEWTPRRGAHLRVLESSIGVYGHTTLNTSNLIWKACYVGFTDTLRVTEMMDAWNKWKCTRQCLVSASQNAVWLCMQQPQWQQPAGGSKVLGAGVAPAFAPESDSWNWVWNSNHCLLPPFLTFAGCGGGGVCRWRGG